MKSAFAKFSMAACSVFMAPALAHACAVCVTGAADASVTDAFNWSVLFLMAAPYAVVAAVVGCLIYARRRSVAQPETEDDGQPLTALGLIQKESGR